MCDGARETIFEHGAWLPIEQVLGTRNIGSALLRIVLRPRTVNDARMRTCKIDHEPGQLAAVGILDRYRFPGGVVEGTSYSVGSTDRRNIF
jgi:hypothetical protein